MNLSSKQNVLKSKCRVWPNLNFLYFAFRIPELTEEENVQLNASLSRMRTFGEAGRDNKLHLLVDAEYTYMNKGISAFALAMMVAFNKVQSY